MQGKTYTIRTTKNRSMSNRAEQVFEKTGTLTELIEAFSYTLEVGYSWNKKIKLVPRNIKSFVKNLQDAYEEKEADSYERTIVSLVD